MKKLLFILSEPQAWFKPGEIQQVISVTRFLVDDFYDSRINQDHLDASLSTSLSNENPAMVFCPVATPKEQTIFRQRADELRQPLDSNQSNTDLKTLIVIGLDNKLLGIDASFVREFITINQATPVPCCPRHIIGNINLRGEVLTVVDISESLGFSPKTLSRQPKAVVVELDNALAAVIIEEIRDTLFDVNPNNIKMGLHFSDTT